MLKFWDWSASHGFVTASKKMDQDQNNTNDQEQMNEPSDRKYTRNANNPNDKQNDS